MQSLGTAIIGIGSSNQLFTRNIRIREFLRCLRNHGRRNASVEMHGAKHSPCKALARASLRFRLEWFFGRWRKTTSTLFHVIHKKIPVASHLFCSVLSCCLLFYLSLGFVIFRTRKIKKCRDRPISYLQDILEFVNSWGVWEIVVTEMRLFKLMMQSTLRAKA